MLIILFSPAYIAYSAFKMAISTGICTVALIGTIGTVDVTVAPEAHRKTPVIVDVGTVHASELSNGAKLLAGAVEFITRILAIACAITSICFRYAKSVIWIKGYMTSSTFEFIIFARVLTIFFVTFVDAIDVPVAVELVPDAH
jgi:hypothetical protein